MRNIWVVFLLVACGQPEPKAPQPLSDASPAVNAVRQGNFELALRESSAELARDPQSSQAAAVRAIARYQASASQVAAELRVVAENGGRLKALDHERGRAAWLSFLGELEGIDRDLSIVAADPRFSLELCIACWEHDWNRNGRIDEGDRRLLELEYDGKGGELPAGDPRRRPTYRFDRGDAYWALGMLSFQRAGVELVLAFRWSELDKLFRGDGALDITIPLVDPGRVQHARELVLAALAYADQTRAAYLAETDDDREWVPSPRQKSYAMPLGVDADLYATWTAVVGDLRNLLDSKEGIAIRDVATIFVGARGAIAFPNAYVDLGAMLREPTDIVIELDDKLSHPHMYERALRGIFGHGYKEAMRASPLVGRVRHMKGQLDRGEDLLGRKLRYLFWLN
jgi:hypothetical protein